MIDKFICTVTFIVLGGWGMAQEDANQNKNNFEFLKPFAECAEGTRLQVETRVSTDGALYVHLFISDAEVQPSGSTGQYLERSRSRWYSNFVLTPHYSSADLSVIRDWYEKSNEGIQSKADLSKRKRLPALPHIAWMNYQYHISPSVQILVNERDVEMLKRFLEKLAISVESLDKDNTSYETLVAHIIPAGPN